jgi:hypothetical protein
VYFWTKDQLELQEQTICIEIPEGSIKFSKDKRTEDSAVEARDQS